MERFLDVVKVNLNENIEKYFRDVEIESIKRSKDDSTLNFYLVSNEIIPYSYIKDVELLLCKELLSIDLEAEENANRVNPIHIYISYHLFEKYTAKLIYEEIRNDLINEFKDEFPILSIFFNEDRIKFVSDDKVVIEFDDLKEFYKYQEEFVMIFKSIFKKRFDMTLDISVLKVKAKGIEPAENNDIYATLPSPNIEDTAKKENTENETKQNSIKGRKKKGFGFVDEGNVIYGRPSKVRRRLVPISSIQQEMDGIEVKGLIFFLDKKDIKNGKTIFSVKIYDGESAIETKIWGDPDDKDSFQRRFAIGDLITIAGKSQYDSFVRGYIIHPQCISKESHRDVLEFNKNKPDYYNIFITDREDNEKDKRVELHLHTKASAQDAIGEVTAYIDTARKFGMPAMAITDHGCVNSLADAYEHVCDLKKKDKSAPMIKIINGVEGYLVEDFESVYFDKDGHDSNVSHPLSGKFVVYDFITTGFNKKNDSIIGIEARKIDDFRVIDTFRMLAKTTKPLSFETRERTGVLNENLVNAPDLKDVLAKFIEFSKDSIFVTIKKNIIWDLSDVLKRNGLNDDINVLDLNTLSRLAIEEIRSARPDKIRLLTIANALKVKVEGLTDRKGEDKKKTLFTDEMVNLACPIFLAILDKLRYEYELKDLIELKDKFVIDKSIIKRQPYTHIVLLAKNDVGRVNLYKLVSDSHIDYMYNRKPRIPRSLLTKYREGIIVGSACIAGEFMNAIKCGIDDEKLKEIASFYDYLEIQPTLNNSFLLNEDKENFKDIKDLENLNKKVIEIGDALGKPVVATCDCHYIEKEDKIFREVLRLGATFKKSNLDKDGNVKAEVKGELESSHDEELYFRTTREMLDEFSYLGVDKAREVVIENSQLINNMIEDIVPLRPDKCPPSIKGSEEELIKSCHENLKLIYGDNPIKEIVDRLDNELSYINDNGYSVMYIAAKKLIDYSKANGYQVGSRGSVGSSLAATLSGVSEVNPLPPHYICPKCHHIEYETEETKKYDNDTGFDMPDKRCPECNTMMNKNGVNIPFETFLGIPGNPKAQKEPDIDLNFASVFQSRIHKKTIDLFGEKNTFKAGTVGTVAATTAYGYVRRFESISKLELTNAQRDYYKSKIIDCKNNTGQHPGGMIVVPDDEEIYTFTPINIAADKEGNAITTHYDYHKIDKNLLKLDILGHDSPLILKKLGELTGTDPLSVPFYDEKVMGLFKGTESLGLKPSDISGTKLGCLSIPEFGTDFAMGMCEDAKPKTVADLIRIAGLAHGTDVWQGNVQDLIKNGDCTLSSAICCRDDIMLYLIDKGLEKGLAFNIMESVRKGKGLTNDWVDEMKKHDVPDWYIGCCKKIKYMFPKAHAAAYVLASLRIAYYKIYYPKEYYATYFSVKKNGIDYSLLLQSREEIHHQIEKINRIIEEKKANDKKFAERYSDAEKPMEAIDKVYKRLKGDDEEVEKVELDKETLLSVKYESMSANNLFDLFMCYRIVEEMRVRGIEFCPIDIYEAKRSDFRIVGGKIMPSFDSIPGIGTKEDEIDYDPNTPIELRSTAMKCELESLNGEYTSIEDFRRRTGVNKTITEQMKSLGLLNGLRESEQSTILDYLK